MPSWVTWISDIAIIAASLAAVIGACITLRSYRALRPEAELQRRQNVYFLRLSAQIALMFTLLLTMHRNLRDDESLPAFFVPPLSDTARQLLSTLDGSTEVDVTHELIGHHASRWDRHMAVRAALMDAAEMTSAMNTERATKKELGPIYSAHLWLGLLDIASRCELRALRKDKQNRVIDDLRGAMHDVETDARKLLRECREHTDNLWT